MRYLIAGGHGIGDLVLLFPMIRMIHKNDPKAVIDLFTKSDRKKIKINLQLLKAALGINKMTYYNLHELFHTVMFELDLLTRKKYDYGFFISYKSSPKSSIWPYVIERPVVKKMIGTRLDYKPIVKFDTAISRINPDNSIKKVIDIERDLLNAIGYNTSLDLENEKFFDTEMLRDLLPSIPLQYENSPIISMPIGVWQPAMKAWPIEYCVSLINMLADKKMNIYILGGKAEEKVLERNGDILNKKGVFSLVGKCNILQTLAVINASNLVIGPDTGILHSAWALNVPSLYIFGPTSPSMYFQGGRKSSYIKSNYKCVECFSDKFSDKWQTCKDNLCMKAITPEIVFDKVMDILNKYCPEKLEG